MTDKEYQDISETIKHLQVSRDLLSKYDYKPSVAYLTRLIDALTNDAIDYLGG